MQPDVQAKLFPEDDKEDDPANVMRVLVPYPVDKAYDYALPEGMSAEAGDYVCVPLGNREVPAVMWGASKKESDGSEKHKKLKSVISKYPLMPMKEEHRLFLDKVAAYTMSAKGSVLKMSLSAPAGLEEPKPVVGYRLAPSPGLTSFDHPLPLGEREVSAQREQGEGGKIYQDKPPQYLIEKSKDLRKNQTESEKKLWFKLRDRRLEGCKFKRQYQMPPYIVDFICLEKKIIIEVDGGQHSEQKEYDAKRTEFLESKGYRVLRFWNNEVFENLDGVLLSIKEAIDTSTPTLPHEWGRGIKLSPKQQKVIDVIQDGKVRRPAEIARLAGCTAGVVKTLAGKGLLEAVQMRSAPPCRDPNPEYGRVELSQEQESVAQTLRENFSPPYPPAGGGEAQRAGGEFKAILLDGVTGAGKTETYFEAVAAALQNDKQVLILLPEIALSNAFLDRFEQRFGCQPALWHSNLTPAQRRNTWRGVAEGQTKVVVGARSALFLPYQELGLIIVDEEHDPAYKQEDGVMYHARDMAVLRAHIGQFPVLLVSATPSLETMQNVWDGKYQHLELPVRYGGALMPDISLIDLREDKPERGDFVAPSLRKAVIETLERGEQALLFLNRRGYAPLTICRSCGHRMNCPRCTAWLVEHKKTGRHHCHHCAYQQAIPDQCPECDDHDSFAVCGPGVERIFEEMSALLPDMRIEILASDLAESDAELREKLERIKSGAVDLIIGTQIIAKGHHFPNLTCVGVVDADLGLNGGELRASERTYQLLHQVAGRAGREEKPGQVYLQSFMPEHRIMQALASTHSSPPLTPPLAGGKPNGQGGRDQFLRIEADERAMAHMPPFSRLAGIIVSGREEPLVQELSKYLGRTAPQGQEGKKQIQTLGPVPAPLARLRGKYRYRLLVCADKAIDLQKAIQSWIEPIKTPSSIRIQIDIDPQSFY